MVNTRNTIIIITTRRAIITTRRAWLLMLLLCVLHVPLADADRRQQERTAAAPAVLQAGAVVTVRVRKEAVVRGEGFTLGDIADIQAKDTTIKERLQVITLGLAPGVGVVRELARGRISLAIIAAGFPETGVRLEAPPVVQIKRASQIVDPTRLRSAAEQAALAKLGADETNKVRGRLVRLDLPTVIEVPSGAVEVRASIGAVRDYSKPLQISIEVWVDGRSARRINLMAQLEVIAPVMVARRDLPARSRVSDEDVGVEERPLERAAAFYVRDAARLRGTVMRRLVMRGEAITTDLAAAEIIVKPGDQVRIIGESTRVSVVVTGEARASGRIGDRIQVKNLQSGLLLQATVVDEGVVRVRF